MASDIAARSGRVFQRFEAKYLLREVQAQALCASMHAYVTPDLHSTWDTSYSITSLYLDHPELTLYRSSLFGEKNRFKLRVRSYEEGLEAPVYLEVKRRIDRVIVKERVAVRRSCLPELLRGEGYREDVLCEPGAESMQTLLRFRSYLERVGAVPVCMVRYEREAYMSAFEEPVRISLDRRMTAREVSDYSHGQWRYDSRYCYDVDVFDVLLEIKFTDALPLWTRELIGRHELSQRSLSKYVECASALKRGCVLPQRMGVDHGFL